MFICIYTLICYTVAHMHITSYTVTDYVKTTNNNKPKQQEDEDT